VVSLPTCTRSPIVVGYFADHPFPIGRAPAADLAPVIIEVPKEN